MKNMFAIRVLTVLYLLSEVISGIKVNSKLGIIEGFIDEVNVGPSKVNIVKYLGIPYAKPPIGNLRFSKPIPYGQFDQPFNATDYGASCEQFYPGVTDQIRFKSEDCLFLNIFSPDIDQSGNKYPVMIWIHGGSFLFGDGRWRTFDKLPAFGKVILVTMNYRLGPFGFLDSEDKTISGNYGLWDQHMAIQWVHDNIESFNGNPGMVTIFGESAGSGAVMYQAIYPGNSGLFQRVIAQSGSANANWALIRDPNSKMKILADRLGCTLESSVKIINCLRDVKNTTVMSMNSLIVSLIGGMDFGPSLDDDFVTQERRDVLNFPLGEPKLDFFNKLDVMMGTTGDEGDLFLSLMVGQNILKILSNVNSTETEVKQAMRDMMTRRLRDQYDEKQVEAVLDAVLFQYSDFQNDRNSRMSHIVDYITDSEFFPSMYSSILNHVYNNTESRSYYYEFNEIYPFIAADPWLKGARHAEDIEYMFGTVYDTGIKNNMSQSELDVQWKLSSAMMTYWTNFAKTG